MQKLMRRTGTDCEPIADCTPGGQHVAADVEEELAASLDVRAGHFELRDSVRVRAASLDDKQSLQEPQQFLRPLQSDEREFFELVAA